ncbi:MAG TPA: adenylyltransferase/cytidyltransferase family protein [Candidatus Paceibacterota bacterium]|nr:adenylyltransferase/cytidyltransferase family protein [Candidatus Paceibacterota bacterium]
MQRVQRVVSGTATFQDILVLDHEEVLKMAEVLRSMGCAIAYTEGVWDLLHRGHCAYIEKGREETMRLYPDAEKVIMVIGVDSDALTKARKGPDRPAIPEEERCEMLGFMRVANIITVLHEPEVFNRRLRPEVRIISQSTGDNPDMEDMKRYCGELVCLPPQRPTGTTAIIRKFAIEGGASALESARAKLVEDIERAKEQLGAIQKEIGREFTAAVEQMDAVKQRFESALEEALDELKK